MYIYIILFIIFIILLCFYYLYRLKKRYNSYHIVCARYNKPVDFLNKIPIDHTIVQKDVDVINKGHEATSYLYYIIKNYNNLPENVIFIHDEDESWHHTGKISNNIYKWIDNYENEGKTYYEFNSVYFHKDGTNMHGDGDLYNNLPGFKRYWDEALRYYLGPYEDAKPEGGQCCAQFIISRETIRKNPQHLYFHLFNWLVKNTNGEGNGNNADIYSGWFTSRYSEWSWRFIFTDQNQN